MTRVSGKAAPVDPADVAAEETRRAGHAANETLQAGRALAKKDSLNNLREELKVAYGDLARMARVPGSLQAARLGYDRIYAKIERLVQVLANETGEQIEYPDYDPPQLVAAKMRTIGPAAKIGQVVERPDGTKATVIPAETYKERAGHGPSGKGLPLKGPGSNVDPDWADTAADTGWLGRILGK